MIGYSLESNSEVRLIIYNLRGQMVRTLISGAEQNAGYHHVRWDGTDDVGNQLPSGTYIYELMVGQSNFDAKRMLLLK
jgi:flagellar hook assembly protein FlgD